MTKDEALKEIEKEWQALQKVISKIGGEWWDLPAARTGTPPWKVRDVLYHIAIWELNLLDRAKKRLDPSRKRQFNYPGKNYHEQNLKILREGRTKSPEEILNYQNMIHKEIIKTLKKLPDEEIIKDGKIRSWVEGETITHPGQHRRVQLEPLIKT